jgi:hypothetical protein
MRPTYAFLLLIATGCSTPLPSPCVPGETNLCLCEDTSTGVQSCLEDGAGYGACACGSVLPDGGDGDVTEEDSDGNGTPSGDETDSDDCTPENFQGCDGDAIVWFDSCGAKGAVVETCVSPQTCENASCIGCEANAVSQCSPGGDGLYWFDSCGEQGTLIAACPTGTSCVAGTCISACTPHATQECHNDDLWWFDSCGETESVAKACEEEQFCLNDACVKPFYDGVWKLEALPNSKAGCAGEQATFPPQYLELVVNGSTATGHIDVLEFDVNFTGTLEGKNLQMIAYWSQQGTPPLIPDIDHEETLDVVFTSPTTFEGTDTDVYTTELLGIELPCSLYWIVTGERQ